MHAVWTGLLAYPATSQVCQPPSGPVYLSKIDIADGFYRIWVRASYVPKLGVLFPSADGDEYLVGFPLALPMGCTEPPQIFTAATEMVADIANTVVSLGSTFGLHRLDSTSEIRSAPPSFPPGPDTSPPLPSRSGSHPLCHGDLNLNVAPIMATLWDYGMCMLTTFWAWFKVGSAHGVAASAHYCTP
jgi:hypothetical protein